VSVRRFCVDGRVQGVGFRAFVLRAARGLGLSGAVRNDLDGRVTAVAVGPPERLDELARQLSVGPPASRVRAVEQRELAALPADERFDVRF